MNEPQVDRAKQVLRHAILRCEDDMERNRAYPIYWTLDLKNAAYDALYALEGETDHDQYHSHQPTPDQAL